jgi:hypothetical protein
MQKNYNKSFHVEMDVSEEEIDELLNDEVSSYNLVHHIVLSKIKEPQIKVLRVMLLEGVYTNVICGDRCSIPLQDPGTINNELVRTKTNSDYSKSLNSISWKTATTDLKQLVLKGLLTRVGEGKRNIQYVLPDYAKITQKGS